MNKYLDISPEVSAALAAGKPVVALESTIISHGMPYPQNVKTALAVAQIIRDNGAVPAPIAIIGGWRHAAPPPPRRDNIRGGGGSLNTHGVGQQAHRATCDARHLRHGFLHSGTASRAAHASDIVLLHFKSFYLPMLVSR